jgi:tetratricopeptide (TPR) repeat protein
MKPHASSCRLRSSLRAWLALIVCGAAALSAPTVRAGGPPATDTWDQAKKAFASGNYEAAIDLLNPIIQKNPSADALCLRGECFRKSWSLQNASKDFQQAVKLDPKNARAHFHQGLINEYRGYWTRALADYGKALQFDPNLALPYIARGGIRWRRGEIEKAKGDLNRGIKLCNEALLAAPDDFLTYRARALAHRTLRQFDHAIDDYAEMKRIRTDSVEAYVESGRTHAVQHKQLMNKVSTGGGRTMVDKAHRCKASSVADFDRAIELASRLIRKKPESPRGCRLRTEAYDAKAFAWKQPADFMSAVGDLNFLARLSPDCPTVYFRRGHVWAGLTACDGNDEAAPKHFRKAMADLTKALRLDSTFAAALCERGLTCLRLAQRRKSTELAKQGEADLAKTLKLAPQEGRVFCFRGSARFLAGDFAGALADSNKAIELCPELPEAYVLRGGINDIVGDKEAAHADLAQARKLQERLR